MMKARILAGVALAALVLPSLAAAQDQAAPAAGQGDTSAEVSAPLASGAAFGTGRLNAE